MMKSNVAIIDNSTQFVKELIKKTLKKDLTFEELNSSNKQKILKKIEKSNVGIIVFQKRGFDILQDNFFVFEYVLDYRSLEGYILEKKQFVKFDEYFEYLKGDVYDQSCYFGYIFSDEEIKKYQIDKNRMNFESYIEYDIFDFDYKDVWGDRWSGSYDYSTYQLTKMYKNGKYIVIQEWFNIFRIPIISDRKEFDFFCDFVHYLDKDLSKADLLDCDGLENLSKITNLNINNIRVRSKVSESLGLKLNLLPQTAEVIDFDKINENESLTIKEFIDKRNDDDYNNVSYITDIHLLHRYEAWKCITYEDREYVNRLIIREITKGISLQNKKIFLIGGDLSSDYESYDNFISSLAKINTVSKFFYTLGNHELWPFASESLNDIVKRYRSLLTAKGMYLVHNNLFFFDGSQIQEVTTDELETIGTEELRIKLKSAYLIIFGGIGFSGKNDQFNANDGIYRKALTREQEILESAKFDALYNKVAKAAFDRSVIVFTHMPIQDWHVDGETIDGFVYVYGHNHRNYYFDDNKKRIYADNQVGYKQKSFGMKELSIDYQYDWYSDFNDGIYEITKEDYIRFYRGKRELVMLNRQFSNIYMIKRNRIYMFFMRSLKGTLLILDGGRIRKAGNHSLEYYYNHMVLYSNVVKEYLLEYEKYQKKVSQEIKSIGGNGRIHGCIIDIDYFNHLYINPLDGSITPYFAYSMTDKYVYKNIPSLLKYQCKELYCNLENRLLGKNENALAIADKDIKLCKKVIPYYETDIYSISRIIKGLQFTTQSNVIRIWNDSIFENVSNESGRILLQNLLGVAGED